MTALKLFLSKKSNNAIASSFCAAVLKEGFDGQLIFATVATHAALNSLSTSGSWTRKGSTIIGISSLLWTGSGRLYFAVSTLDILEGLTESGVFVSTFG